MDNNYYLFYLLYVKYVSCKSSGMNVRWQTIVYWMHSTVPWGACGIIYAPLRKHTTNQIKCFELEIGKAKLRLTLQLLSFNYRLISVNSPQRVRNWLWKCSRNISLKSQNRFVMQTSNSRRSENRPFKIKSLVQCIRSNLLTPTVTTRQLPD